MSAVKPNVVYGFIPNLINGISQQPSNIRFPNQADSCINTYPNLQEWCGKRPPLKVDFPISLGGFSISNTSKCHEYMRDLNEGYEIVFNGSGLPRCIGLHNGTVYTPSQVGASDGYLTTSNPKTDIFCFTYKDTTFVVNRAITCSLLSGLSSTRTPEALINVINAGTGFTYEAIVTIGANSPITASFTASSTDTVNTVATDLNSDLNATVVTQGGTTSIYGNVVHVSHPTLPVKIQVKDNRTGTALKALTNKVEQVSDLPVYAPNGYIVTVTGSTSNQNAADNNVVDDVIYRFETQAGAPFSSGIWQEGVAPGIKYQIDPATMPHKLVRTAGGTFEYSQISWASRDVGDEITNPNPNFIGNTIHSCLINAERFGFVGSGGYYFSRTGEANFFDMWRQTTLVRLDSDPVFGVVPSANVNKPYWGISWNGSFQVFGDTVDGNVVTTGTSFSLDKISTDTPTAFGISPLVGPLISGGSLLFPKNNGDYTIVYNYKVNPLSTEQKDADNLTSYVGTFIPKDIIKMVGLEKDLVCLLADGVRNKLYFYNYAVIDNKVAQQAWHNWEFDSAINIYSVYIYNRVLRIFYSFNGSTFLGSIPIAVGTKDTGLPDQVRLDFRISEVQTTESYNSTTNRTTITTPWSFGSSIKVLELRAAFNDFPAGYIPTIESQTATTIVLEGDYRTAQFYVGVNYRQEYIPCQFHKFTQNTDGSGIVADEWVEIVVKRLLLSFQNTGYYRIEIRDRTTNNLVSADEKRLYLDSNEQTYDQYVLQSGKYLSVEGLKFDIQQNKIVIINDTSKPSYFTGISWIGDARDAKM